MKNSVANVARGGAAGLAAVILPPFLARLMQRDTYATWLLILQLSAYLGYLDFGIQTAIGRFVAHANEKNDADHRDRIVSTSLLFLAIAGVVGLAGGVAMAALLPHIFRQIPPLIIGQARLALFLVAFSSAIGLPASVLNGIFIGIQRYELPAGIIGGSRIVSAALIILVVKHGGNLVEMGLTVALVNLASYGIQYLMYRKLVPDIAFSARQITMETGRELFNYCWSLSVWSLGMLLIAGLDVTLVGYFQFQAVVYYGVSATLISFLAGLQTAAFGVLIPSTAVLQARGSSRELGKLMIAATRYGTFLLLLTGFPLLLWSRKILTLWVGASYAEHGEWILQILVIANVIRLSATPYAVTLIGTGQQRLVTITPLLEGFSNLLVSVVAGYLFGAIGVALGTLIGSFVGVGGNFLYNMRRTVGFDFTLGSYLRDGLLRPMICALPLTVFVIVTRYNHTENKMALSLCSSITLILTICLIWRWGLVGWERERLRPRRLAAEM